MKKYYSVHPEHLKDMDTEEIRKNFLVPNIMVENECTFNYSFEDRNIIGGIYTTGKEIKLPIFKDLGTNFFLERREIGLINIEGTGTITIDGETFEMKQNDGIYIPMGKKEITFNTNSSMKLYYNSAPAHKSHQICHIDFEKAQPKVLGSSETMNSRTIYQYIHPDVCDSCQLLMGMTVLNEGSCWNTFPPHTHERRMESYFYFKMQEQTRVFEILGEPEQTRHLVLANEEAFISPSYSIHSGVGTGKYTFIWAMLGENQTFDDMDQIEVSQIK